MVKLSQARIDPDLSREGVWVTVVEGDPPWQVRVARATVRFSRAFQQIDQELRDKMDDETATPEEELRYCELLAPIVVEQLIRDWRGLTDDEGNEIPYSQEKAVEIFSDPGFRFVLSRITLASVDLSLFHAREVGDEGKD